GPCLAMVSFGHRWIGLELLDEVVIGLCLFPCEIDVEDEQRDQSHDGDIVRGRNDFPKLTPIHNCSVFFCSRYGARRGLSASEFNITGAGPEIPPSFLTRQKCTIMKIEATIGMPMQCQM